MHLGSLNKEFPDRVLQVKLSDCKNIYDRSEDVRWLESLFNSLDAKGMLNPILVCKESELKEIDGVGSVIRRAIDYCGATWYIVCGNNRYEYALSRGYTSIDAYELKSKQEYYDFHGVTELESKYF